MIGCAGPECSRGYGAGCARIQTGKGGSGERRKPSAADCGAIPVRDFALASRRTDPASGFERRAAAAYRGRYLRDRRERRVGRLLSARRRRKEAALAHRANPLHIRRGSCGGRLMAHGNMGGVACKAARPGPEMPVLPQSIRAAEPVPIHVRLVC